MNLKSLTAAGLALSLSILSGCASAPASHQQSLNSAPATTSSSSSSSSVPKLKVVNNCACSVPQDIPGLIGAGYNIAAHNAGKPVNAEDEAVFSITKFSKRDSAARLLGGVFAGKDEITGVVSYKGRTFTVNEYYVNIIQTIDDAANKVGLYAFNGLSGTQK